MKRLKACTHKCLIFVLTLFTLISPFINIPKVSAASYVTGTINGDHVNVRTAAGTSNKIITQVNSGQSVTILNYDAPVNPDGYNWYNISTVIGEVTYTGYVRGDYITVAPIADGVLPTTPLEQKFYDAGFPSSYWSYLTTIQNAHPTWKFEAYQTGLNWNDVLTGETYSGQSLIQGNAGYRSTADGSYNWVANTWTVKDGSSWYDANSQTVAYYLDPRNFLDNDSIFMFEKLSYNSSINYQPIVQKIFSRTDSPDDDTFMVGGSIDGSVASYSQTFVAAGLAYNINPVHLASKSIIEVGAGSPTNPPVAVSGAPFIYYVEPTNYKESASMATYDPNVYVTVKGYYNFFNIWANAPSEGNMNTNWKQGVVGAMGYLDYSYKSFGRPWDTAYKAIMGGANFLASNFINAGQDTPYLQKWDVISVGGNYNHQYMTNVQAPNSEASKTYNAYDSLGIIDEAFVFKIPVYTNMPTTKTTLPNEGNPNNVLKSLSTNGISVNSFDMWNLEYNYYVSSATTSVGIAAEPMVSTSTISGLGNINLTSDNTIANVIVTAQNGDKRTYKINIIRTDTTPMTTPELINNVGYKIASNYVSNIGEINITPQAIIDKAKSIYPTATVAIKNSADVVKTGIIGTGDKIVVTNGSQTNAYTIVLGGDTSGDGIIDIKDLLQVQKNILKYSSLVGPYYMAGDVDKDGSVGISDLLKIRKHILGYDTIVH